MSTTSAEQVLRALRERLLSFDGDALRTALQATAGGSGQTGKLYIEQAPDDATYPYGVLHVLDVREDGDDGGFARRWLVELQLTDKPRGKAGVLKAMGDTAERAMRAWVDTTAGVIVAQRGLSRATVNFDEPGVREVMVERLVIPLYVHAQYLTQDSA